MTFCVVAVVVVVIFVALMVFAFALLCDLCGAPIPGAWPRGGTRIVCGPCAWKMTPDDEAVEDSSNPTED